MNSCALILNSSYLYNKASILLGCLHVYSSLPRKMFGRNATLSFILIFFILQLISAWMGGSRTCTYVSIPVCFT